MTRINAGIPPILLSNKHLIAEHREIKRIPNVIAKGKFSLNGQPKEFTLGTGHVKFFYDKLAYLQTRYENLYKECKRRGYNVTYFGDAFKALPDHLMQQYTPTPKAIKLIKQRLKEKQDGRV